MEKKNYVGNAKQRDGKFGPFFSLSVNVDKLNLIKNEKGYARLTMNLNKEPDQYGNTHSIVEDTWKPTPKPTTNSYEHKGYGLDETPF